MICKITIFSLLFLAAACSSVAASQVDDKVDDLFLKASSGELRYRDLVEPSKKELVDMGIDAVPRLVTKLSTEDARERITLVDIFAGIGKPAIPALIGALQTDNLHALRNACECLGRIGDKSATEALLKFFDYHDYSVRSAAVTAVGRCHDSSAVMQCIGMLKDSISSVRKSAAVALGRIGDDIAVTPLIAALDDVHFSVRMTSEAALVSIGDSACAALVRDYDSLSSMARSLAFEVWAKSHYAPAADILFNATSSGDLYLRAFAIESLAYVDSVKAQTRIDEMRQNETDLFVLSRINAAEKYLEKPPE